MQLFSEMKIPASGNRMCKCPGTGECLTMSMKKQEGHWPRAGKGKNHRKFGHIGTRSKGPYRLRTSDLILNVIFKSNTFFKSFEETLSNSVGKSERRENGNEATVVAQIGKSSGKMIDKDSQVKRKSSY